MQITGQTRVQSVSITSALRGTNQWNILGPKENAYSTEMFPRSVRREPRVDTERGVS